jgi:UDP-N-acetylglucosamine acyltransferase
LTRAEIGDGTTIREYVTVNSSTSEGEVTKVGSRCHIMAYCHIAHACAVGNEVIMANCAQLAGEVEVQDQAILGGVCAVHQFVRIGRLCMVGGCSKIVQDCPPFMMVDGNPAEVRGPNSIGLQRRNISAEARTQLKQAYRVLYREGLSAGTAVEKIRAQAAMCPEVEALVQFVAESKRGITK